MAGPDRTTGVLKLFTLDRSEWTVEDAALALGVSGSSAYRYFSILTDAGLLTMVASGRYTLGPAIIQYDRQIQLTDPLLKAAKPVMAELMRFAPPDSTVLLCRMFRETVLCVHQLTEPDRPARVSYERGRPMPLFLGATSKVILAHLPSREMRRVYDGYHAEIRRVGLGGDWETFRKAMAKLRKAGHAVTYAEVDSGRIGLAAPILAGPGRVLGSLSYVVPETERGTVSRLVALAASGARDIEQTMQDGVDRSARQAA